MKRWLAVAILLVIAQVLFAWPDPGAIPSRGAAARSFANLSFPRYGGAPLPPSEPVTWNSRFVPLFFSAIFVLLSLLTGASIHNAMILRRILATMQAPPTQPVDPELALAQKDLEQYLLEPPHDKGQIGGPG